MTAGADDTPAIRVAVRMPNWLGDGVMARAALHDLRHALPDAELHVFAGAPLAALVEGESLRCRVHPLPSGRANIFRVVVPLLRRLRPEFGLVFPPSFSSALAFRLGGVRRRAGFDEDGRRRLLTFACPRADRGDMHLEDEYRLLVARAISSWGVGADPVRTLPPLTPSPSSRRAIEARVERLPRPRLALAPGATFGPTKRWPATSFAELADRFVTRTGGCVVVTGAASDSEATRAVRDAAATAVHDWTGETTVDELAALYASADVVVSNDSGAMHVAAAAGAPVVALFGSTHPAWTGPRGPHVRVLVRSEPCAPCYLSMCDIGTVCLTRISVDEVEAAVFDFMTTGRAG